MRSFEKKLHKETERHYETNLSKAGTNFKD